MKILVVYYSKSGTTAQLAERIAEKLSADKERVTCMKSYDGFWGYLRAGYDSFRGNLPEIAPVQKAVKDYDLVIAGAPIWAGQAASPIRTYLRDHSSAFTRVAFFTTHGGSTPPAAFSEMAKHAGSEPIAELAVSMTAVRNNDYGVNLTQFIEQLRLKHAAQDASSAPN